MPVIFRPHSYKVRVFPENMSYGDPYCGVMLITWQGPDIVEIDLAHGDLTRNDILEIYQNLQELGVKTLHAWRADNHRLTGGKPLRTEGRFTLWESDIDRTIKILSRTRSV